MNLQEEECSEVYDAHMKANPRADQTPATPEIDAEASVGYW